MSVAIVTAAGKGTRFGGDKALYSLGGKPIVSRAISNFERCTAIDEIIVTIPEDREHEFKQACTKEGFKKVRFVTGGETRFHSVRNAVNSITDSDSIALIHDAARPLVSLELIERVLVVAKNHGAAIPVIPVNETVKKVEEDRIIRTVARHDLFLAQTPQGFRTAILLQAYEKVDDPSITDEAMLVEIAGFEVRVVPGEKKNIKITETADIRIAEALL